LLQKSVFQVWRGAKVVRVLKGAHQGPVGDICLMPEDGTFVSGGLKDGAIVVFDNNYQLIGAGATLPFILGSVRRILKRTYTTSEGEEGGTRRYFHLLVGTTGNCKFNAMFFSKRLFGGIHFGTFLRLGNIFAIFGYIFDLLSTFLGTFWVPVAIFVHFLGTGCHFCTHFWRFFGYIFGLIG